MLEASLSGGRNHGDEGIRAVPPGVGVLGAEVGLDEGFADVAFAGLVGGHAVIGVSRHIVEKTAFEWQWVFCMNFDRSPANALFF